MKSKILQDSLIAVILFNFASSASAQVDSTARYEIQIGLGVSGLRFHGIEDELQRFSETIRYPNEQIISLGWPRDIDLTVGISREILGDVSVGLALSNIEKSYEKIADTSFSNASARVQRSYLIQLFSPRIVATYSSNVLGLEKLKVGCCVEVGTAYVDLQKDIHVYTSPGTIFSFDSSYVAWLASDHLQGKYRGFVFEWRVGVDVRYEIVKNISLLLFAKWDGGQSRLVSGDYSVNGKYANMETNSMLSSWFGNVSLGHSGTIFGLAISVPIIN